MKQPATQRREVATFRAVRLENPKGFDPSVEFVVCPWGTHPTSLGPVTVNEHTLQVFEQNQIDARRDAVAGDFNHETLKGREPVKVAGFFNVRVVRDKGIVAALHHETPHMQYVREGNYPDISPAVERDEHGVVEGLHSFAFVRHGKIKHPDLEIFSVEVAAGPAVDAADSSTPKTKTTPRMNDSEMLAELLAALSGEAVAADASAETKAAAFAKAKATCQNMKPAPMSADNKPENKDLTALSAELEKANKRLDAFEAGEKNREIDGLIADATRAGKQIGLKRERLVAMGAEGTKEYLASLPAGVVKTNGDPNAAVQTATQGKGEKPADVFSADTLAMWQRNGIDPAQMLKKHNARIAALSGEPATADDEDDEGEGDKK